MHALTIQNESTETFTVTVMYTDARQDSHSLNADIKMLSQTIAHQPKSMYNYTL